MTDLCLKRDVAGFFKFTEVSPIDQKYKFIAINSTQITNVFQSTVYATMTHQMWNIIIPMRKLSGLLLVSYLFQAA
jgi:hypothetical protein